LQLKPGDRFKFFFHPDGVIILPKIPTSRLKGIIPKPARPVSLEEIDAAIESGPTQRFRHKKLERVLCDPHLRRKGFTEIAPLRLDLIELR
jgi:hypothetical protein